MNEIVKFRYPDSSVNLISVAGIGAIGAGAVNSMRENGLTGVDYFLLNSNQSSEEIAQNWETFEKMVLADWGLLWEVQFKLWLSVRSPIDR